MKLPDEVRERFRQYGSQGGRVRAARLSATRRREVARTAAISRWVRERFGAARFEELGLPGGDLVDAGLAALVSGEETKESLLVSLGAPRLRREGVPVPEPLGNPEQKLYDRIERESPELAHARYNALLRRLVSFADACALARSDRRA